MVSHRYLLGRENLGDEWVGQPDASSEGRQSDALLGCTLKQSHPLLAVIIMKGYLGFPSPLPVFTPIPLHESSTQNTRPVVGVVRPYLKK